MSQIVVQTKAKLQAAWRAARDARTAAGELWDRDLAALKHGAKWAADEGAPGLYEALFGGVRRTKKKKTPAAPVTQPATTPAVGTTPQAPLNSAA